MEMYFDKNTHLWSVCIIYSVSIKHKTNGCCRKTGSVAICVDQLKNKNELVKYFITTIKDFL